ncbi:MAG: hypothetical protein H0T80_04965 [Betaproteobacteria bacterium]|nr:hypothetical protein [Betaproteobacteria bacterium]
MRKQYHFRSSPEGLRAWDVDRLVQLTRALPRQWVPLSTIREIDELYWSNEGTKHLTCRDVVDHARLILDCDFTFPVILSSDGRVMDGMHRICKALFLGHDDIEAVRFIHDPDSGYVGVHPDDLPY